MSRLKWLDWANVLAMVAVVWFHIPSSIEMPVRGTEYIIVNIPFFLFSGFVFSYIEREKLDGKTFAIGLVKSLIVPTLCFFFLFYVLWLMGGKILAGDSEEWYVPLEELLKGDLNVVLATYWFVICLLTINVLYYLFRKLTTPLVTAIMCAVLPVVTACVNVPDVFQLNRALTFIPVFALGAGLCRCRTDKSSFAEIAVVVAMLATWFFLQPFLPYELNYRWNEMLAACVFCGIIYMVSRCLAKVNALEATLNMLRIGALVLLATQNYIIGLTGWLMDKLSGETDYLANHFIYKPLVLIFVYAVSIPLVWVIANKAPFLIGKNKRSHGLK